MGVTFVKVQPVVKKRPGGGDTSALPLSGPMAINAMTRTPIHQRLLRFVYSNAGRTVELSQIASALGVGMRMVDEPLSVFERARMAKRLTDGKVELVWPTDESLQKEVVAWVGRNGLTG